MFIKTRATQGWLAGLKEKKFAWLRLALVASCSGRKALARTEIEKLPACVRVSASIGAGGGASARPNIARARAPTCTPNERWAGRPGERATGYSSPLLPLLKLELQLEPQLQI